MASELIVQTLKGPTSGASANKVIIPSGQTLDASAGTLAPSSGQVISTSIVEINDSQSSANTANTFVDTTMVATFTPSNATSKLYLSISCGGMCEYVNAMALRLKQVIDSTTTYPVLRSRHAFGANSGLMPLPIHLQCLLSPNTTSQITFTLQSRVETADVIRINPNDSGAGSDAQAGTFIIQEIAG